MYKRQVGEDFREGLEISLIKHPADEAAEFADSTGSGGTSSGVCRLAFKAKALYSFPRLLCGDAPPRPISIVGVSICLYELMETIDKPGGERVERHVPMAKLTFGLYAGG